MIAIFDCKSTDCIALIAKLLSPKHSPDFRNGSVCTLRTTLYQSVHKMMQKIVAEVCCQNCRPALTYMGNVIFVTPDLTIVSHPSVCLSILMGHLAIRLVFSANLFRVFKAWCNTIKCHRDKLNLKVELDKNTVLFPVLPIPSG